MIKSDRKLLVIGWDGADWKMINPLIDKGLMPNLEKLVNAGTIGNLSTLDPPFSPMLWTSMATGKRPYTHGVMGFNEPDADGINIRPVLSLSRKCKAIWNILTQEKKKTHTVAWWPSHPAEPINGVAISNFYQRAMNNSPENWDIAPQSIHPTQMELINLVQAIPRSLDICANCWQKTAAFTQPSQISSVHKNGILRLFISMASIALATNL